MKTTFLPDRDGKPIRVGDSVRVFIQGHRAAYLVKRLRPRNGEVVVGPEGHYKPASQCELIG
jgi:hypothetical protein